MNDHRSIKTKISSTRLSLIASSIIGACFIYLLSVSWSKWGELVIDTSRELFVPWQVLKGNAIYKDVWYPYGFLPPYILSWFYHIFGVCIKSLVICGIGTTALTTMLLYRISRFFLDEIYSALTVITFLFVFAFGFYVYNGIFNFILPYSFASTFFMTFAAASLYFFLRFILIEKKKPLILWSVFLSGAFFCRPDISFFIWIGFMVSGIIFILKNRNSAGILLYLASPLIISILGYLAFISANHAFSGFKESIIDCIKFASQTKLAIIFAGLNDPLMKSVYAVRTFLLHIIVLYFLIITSAGISSLLKHKEAFRLTLMIEVFFIFIIFFLTRDHLVGYFQYTCLPVVLLLGGITSLIGVISSSDYKKSLSSLTLFLVSMMMIPRIFLNTVPYNYGFYLLSFGVICYYVFFSEMFKEFLEFHNKVSYNAASPVLFIFFIFLIIPHWERSLAMYSYKNLRVTTDKGTVTCHDTERSRLFWEAVTYLTRNTSKNDTLAVFPEGASINFFTGRNSPLKYYSFLPIDCEIIGEERIASDLARSNIDYVVILSRDATEYGYPAFGFDYAKKIYSWITANYVLVKQFGPFPNTSNEFGVAIFKRKKGL